MTQTATDSAAKPKDKLASEALSSYSKQDISAGSKYFVAFVFISLALSFIATTGVFIYEFWDDNQWFNLGVYYSHLFVFFPTFGLIALYAFYLPSTVFVDLYWSRNQNDGKPHIRLGRTRFVLGSLLIVAMSIFISFMLLKGELPTIWDIKPEILTSDKSRPENCKLYPVIASDIPCQTLGLNAAVRHVRKFSAQRVGLSKFIRQCRFDPLLPEPISRKEKRHCFANGLMQTARQCCTAQKELGNRLIDLKNSFGQQNLSLTGKVHAILLPLKVFFLIILLFIGGMLVLWTWRGHLDQLYAKHMYNIERGLISGVAAMIVWPMTNHAFLQSATVLFGYNYHKDSFFSQSAPIFSILFGVWAVLILLYFLQHKDRKDIEIAFKFLGVFASGIAVLKYDLLIDYFVRFAGSGVDYWTIVFMIVALLVIMIPLANRKPASSSKDDEAKQKENFLKGK